MNKFILWNERGNLGTHDVLICLSNATFEPYCGRISYDYTACTMRWVLAVTLCKLCRVIQVPLCASLGMFGTLHRQASASKNYLTSNPTYTSTLLLLWSPCAIPNRLSLYQLDYKVNFIRIVPYYYQQQDNSLPCFLSSTASIEVHIFNPRLIFCFVYIYCMFNATLR